MMIEKTSQSLSGRISIVILLPFSRTELRDAGIRYEWYEEYLYRGLDSNLFYWQDKTGHEIDCLIDRAGTEIIPAGRKSEEQLQEAFFKIICTGITCQVSLRIVPLSYLVEIRNRFEVAGIPSGMQI
ncbi:MAG: hypothetical protein JXA44_06740 [Methanospirillaceae archaeon]|nr:hypothetical protein [Methanospirillaceae archaeon]